MLGYGDFEVGAILCLCHIEFKENGTRKREVPHVMRLTVVYMKEVKSFFTKGQQGWKYPIVLRWLVSL